MTLDSKQKGNLTELQCIASCMELGYTVSIPYGDTARYDFILDIGIKLLRIQVKTCRNKQSIVNSEDAIEFSCRSVNINAKGVNYHTYDKDQIDYFATYWNGICYLVSVEDCNVAKTLWLKTPKNNQKTKISKASDYELEKIINKELSEVQKHD